MNLYDQQKKNLGNTRLFIAFFVVLLALMGLGADGLLYAGGFSPGIPFATLGAIAFGGMSAWWSLREGDKAVLQSTGAIPLDRNDPKQRVLDNVVEEIAIAGGIPKPAVYVVPDSDPNAFATGVGPERASIAVTRGLLDTLDRDELQGVVGHELSHVRNYDILTTSIAATLAAAITYLGTMARWGMIFGGMRDEEDNRGGGLISVLLLAFLAPLAAMLLQLMVSRRRESAADETGARLVGHPYGLISALEKLGAYNKQIPMAASPAASSLYIVKPLSGDGFAGLFSTHPPLEERIAALKQMVITR